MKYRAEIDGLRALAVVPVILYHAGFNFFNGGFIGVDIFFVISGYLITTILIEDIENKSFSITNFYERRARRILPALIFTLILMVLLSWLLLSPPDMRKVFQELVANAFFASNFYYTLTFGYFDQWTLPPIFLNSWSLAVEEQFYLIIPLLLILFQKHTRIIVMVLVCLSLASIVVMNLLSNTFPKANYYLISSRFWELAIGALLAYFMKYKIHQVTKIQQIIPSWISLLLLFTLAIFFVSYNDTGPYPSNWTLLILLTTAAIILLTEQHSFAGKILSNHIIVYVGKLSYPLYLVHFPIIILTKKLFLPRFEQWQIAVFSIICSVLLSIFIYHYVEYFFRTKRIFKTKFVMLSGSIFAMFLLAFVGIMGHFNYIESLSLKKYPELSHLKEKAPLPVGLSITDCAGPDSNKHCELIYNNKKMTGSRQILIVGDSFAADLISPIWKMLSDVPNIGLSAQITYSCSFMPNTFGKWNGECGKARERIDKLSSDKVSDIIFHIDFIGSLKGNHQNTLENLESLTNMFESLIERGVNISVIGNRDTFNFEPVRMFLYPWLAQEFKLNKDVLMLSNFYNNWMNRGINVHKKNKIIKISEAYNYYTDSSHLSYAGSIDFLSRVGIYSSEDLLKIK
ncbi:acyltransferase [Candidatus Pelagibacter sp.]|nr:acyltransferase [Candidatus Pelagibacter sp.]